MNAASSTDNSWLIADIGATSTRCAIHRADAPAAAELEVYENDDFASLEAVLADYLGKTNDRPRCAALALAAPITGDDVRMTNRDWRFNRQELRDRLGLQDLAIINDFHAVAFALANIGGSDCSEIGTASAYRGGTRAVLGPGTGLGVGGWIVDGEAAIAMFGEGGHVTLPARNIEEERIVAKLREQFGHCSAERVLSGPGLITLHSAMHGTELATSREITADDADPACHATVEQFFRFLGSVAADLALTTGALGGVYIAGGIVPDMIERIKASGFRERFEDKNRYRGYMRAIPTYVIVDPLPGLTGLRTFIGSIGRSL